MSTQNIDPATLDLIYQVTRQGPPSQLAKYRRWTES